MLTGGVRFTKMQALGNDYVYIDAISQVIPDPSALAKQMSDRHFGVGSDGLVLICPPGQTDTLPRGQTASSTSGEARVSYPDAAESAFSGAADFRMRIFNPDGSEAEMCGNAIRSVAKYVYHYGLTSKREMKIETLGGIKTLYLEIKGGAVTNITAEIGPPILESGKIPVLTSGANFINQPVTLQDRVFHATAMSLGNPHCVSFVDDVFNFDLMRYGPLMEENEIFPRKTNVEFCEVITRERLRLRTWERNTGETMACGTGCCACVTAGVLNGLCAPVADIEQLGGFIHVDWENGNGRLFMTGPSEIVFEGVWGGKNI